MLGRVYSGSKPRQSATRLIIPVCAYMTFLSDKRIFSPRDTLLYPAIVERIHVDLGYRVPKGERLMELRTAGGSLLSVRAPIAGAIVGVEVRNGDRLDGACCLIRILPADEAPRSAPGRPTAAGPSPAASGNQARPSEPGYMAQQGTVARRPHRHRFAKAVAGALIVVGLSVVMLQQSGIVDLRDLLGSWRRAKLAGTIAGNLQIAFLDGKVPVAQPWVEPEADAPQSKASPDPEVPERDHTEALESPFSKEIIMSLPGSRTPGRYDVEEDRRFGTLVIWGDANKRNECPAIRISPRYLAVPQFCLPAFWYDGEPLSVALTFETTGHLIGDLEPGVEDKPNEYFFRYSESVSRLLAAGNPVGGYSILLAELTADNNSSGHLGPISLDPDSPPGFLTLRKMPDFRPHESDLSAYDCRYWAPSALTGMLSLFELSTVFEVDPDCADLYSEHLFGTAWAELPDKGSRVVGFFRGLGESGDLPAHASGDRITGTFMTVADIQLIIAAQKGALPPVTALVGDLAPPAWYPRILVNNSCEREIRVNIFTDTHLTSGTVKRGLAYYKVDASEGDRVKFSIGLGQKDNITEPYDWNGTTYNVVDTRFSSSADILIVPRC